MKSNSLWKLWWKQQKPVKPAPLHMHRSNPATRPFCSAEEVRFPICLYFVSNSTETRQKWMRVELMDCPLGHAWLSISLAIHASRVGGTMAGFPLTQRSKRADCFCWGRSFQVWRWLILIFPVVTHEVLQFSAIFVQVCIVLCRKGKMFFCCSMTNIQQQVTVIHKVNIVHYNLTSCVKNDTVVSTYY